MDYEALRGGLEVAVPFNTHLGLQVTELGDGRATVRLPDEAALRNHVGSQHAGALFSAGEAASGGALVGAFAETIAELEPLAAGAEISYSAIALGPIDAVAALDEPADALRDRLAADGEVAFSVSVRLLNGAGDDVAAMTVRWDVRTRAA